MMVVYFGYILLIAFNKPHEFLAQKNPKSAARLVTSVYSASRWASACSVGVHHRHHRHLRAPRQQRIRR
jgi:hypothetical protein